MPVEPTLLVKQYQELSSRAAAKNLTIPAIPHWSSRREFPLRGWLSTPALPKALATGQSESLACMQLAIVDRGEATAADVIGLKEEIQQRVPGIWGIRLQPEPVFVGFGSDAV